MKDFASNEVLLALALQRCVRHAVEDGHQTTQGFVRNAQGLAVGPRGLRLSLWGDATILGGVLQNPRYTEDELGPDKFRLGFLATKM